MTTTDRAPKPGDVTRIGPREMESLGELLGQEINLAMAPAGQRLSCLVRIPKDRADKLIAKGLIEPGKLRVGRDCLGAIEVDCYYLTEGGRYVYCMSVGEEIEG